MLFDRPQITESSVIVNATVPSSAADPASPSIGELYFRTDLGALRIYTGAWVEAGSAGLTAHSTDTAIHLSTAQNTLLDGLNLPTLTAAHLNFLTGLTQNVEAKFTAIDGVNSTQNSNISVLQGQSTAQNTALSTHVGDSAVHLTAGQNTMLDAAELLGLPTGQQLNYLIGVTSPIQTQLNSLSTNKYDKSGGTISGNVSISGELGMAGNRITGLGAPIAATDAVTKAYVDAIEQGISWKLPVVAATTTNIASLTGAMTLDSVPVVAGNRVLVKNQITASQNGIYIVSNGAWSRSTDSDVNTELENAAVFIQNGLTQADSGWVQTTPASSIGAGFTGSQSWVQFTTVGGVSSSGTGILISGNTISVRAGHGLTFGVPTSNDLTISGTSAFTFSGSQLDLSNTGVAAATYGSFGQVPAITVDAKGRVTAASNAINITSGNIGSSVVARDGSGNFVAGTMTGNVIGSLTGTATNATQLGGVAASGYALLTGATFTGDITTLRSGSPTTGVIYLGNSGARYLFFDGSQYYLNGANLQINSSLALTAANYTSYAPTLTGGGASGTWSINISGSAAQVGGLTPSVGVVGSTVVARDASGYLYANYLNSTDNSTASGVTAVMVKAGDNFIRSGTAGAIAAFVSGQSINTTGNAASATLAAKASTLAQNGGNGAAMTFNWAGQSGQPSWLWGGNDGSNHYVYNPSNFSVNYANSAGNSATTSQTSFSTMAVTSTNNTSFGGAAGGLQPTASPGTTGATISFHRPGFFGVNMGLDSDNIFRIGGWSAPAGVFNLDMVGNVWIPGQMTASQYSGSVSGTYGAITVGGSSGGYSGIVLTSVLSGYPVIGMFDSSGNGGTWDPIGSWHTYWNRANACLGIGGSTTLGGYKAYVNGSQYTAGNIAASGSATVGGVTISSTSPTLTMRDADNLSAFLHVNSNLIYFLRGDGTNSASWDGGPNGRHPMTMDLTSGNVTFSGNVTAYSDRRLKKDIEPIYDALNKVKQLQGVSFKRIDTNEFDIGVIAQDVQKVVPEVVKEDKDGYLAVAYGNLVALLIESVKELSAEVTALKAELAKDGK